MPNMKNFIKKYARALTCVGLIFISCASSADIFTITESKPISELWLNPGFYSYHFQRNKELNNSNFGLGGEYRYSTASSFSLGEFNNSDRKTSRYAGWYWQPIGMWSIRLGAGLGIIDNYTHMRDGGWFLAAIPTASFEYQNIVANLIVIPSYKDKIYGSISL